MVFALCWALGCDSSPTETTMPGLESFIVNESLILNPTGYVPLAAELQLETSEPVQVELEILGLRMISNHSYTALKNGLRLLAFPYSDSIPHIETRC